MLQKVTGQHCFLQNKDINECYQRYLQWEQYPHTYITSFEALVGPQGGGDMQKQYQEIKNITDFLDINLNDVEIHTIASQLFGGTPTFREGKIDSWKKDYSPENKALFKKIAGQLLIELGYEKDFNW